MQYPQVKPPADHTWLPIRPEVIVSLPLQSSAFITCALTGVG